MNELTNALIEEYGEDLASEIISGFKGKPLTIRVNTLKCDKDYVKEVLDNFNIGYRDVSFYKDALILDCNEDKIREFDIYKKGMIYLQSLSSMIPPLCFDIKANESILDMAAAPGGKTCEIASLSDNKARITATEPNKIRFERLKYNVTKQGARVSVLREDARGLDEFLRFDKILLLEEKIIKLNNILVSDECEGMHAHRIAKKISDLKAKIRNTYISTQNLIFISYFDNEFNKLRTTEEVEIYRYKLSNYRNFIGIVEGYYTFDNYYLNKLSTLESKYENILNNTDLMTIPDSKIYRIFMKIRKLFSLSKQEQ